MTSRTFTAGFLFCGLGAGARGFLEARASLAEHAARFVSVGGIDLDQEACADFETLTGSRATVADVATMTPAELRAAWGERAPDCVFSSPPCKGFSRLLSTAASTAPKYQALNRLVLQGIWLLLETWPDAPPATIVIENVPAITSRGAELLAQVRDLLTRYGYRLHEGTHDCGEVGGLAQHRRRYLLVARRETVVSAFIYRPPALRVRGCGEVLGDLPLPIGNHQAGQLHELPKVSWLTLVRLALIPPGGDWRDLPGVVRAGHQRREVFARYDVRKWSEPARTVAGSGTNGGFGVADPRIAENCSPNRHRNQMRVTDWERPTGTVTGSPRPGSGAPSVADPRVAELVGLKKTADGAATFKGRPGLMRVADWREPSNAVTGSASPTGSNGVGAVADERTIEAAATIGCSPRNGSYGVLSWEEAAGTVTGTAKLDNGRFSVADPRKAPPMPVVIRSAWDCWHRPMTTLELAALQGLPVELGGQPLLLAGSSTGRWRERIGNAVPVGAGRAIAESVLLALLASSLGTWTLSSEGIWVRNDGRSEREWAREESHAL